MRRMVSLLVLALTLGWLQPTTPATAIGEIAMYESVLVDAPIPRAGDLINVAGLVESQGKPVPGLPVTLQVKRYGDESFSDLITVVTGKKGRVEVNFRPKHTIRTRWVFAGNEEFAPYSTPGRIWRIGSRATLQFSDREPELGQRVVVTGRVRPNKAGHTVRVLQGQSNHGTFGPTYPKPTLLATTTVKDNGRYRVRVRFHRTGALPVFVTVSRGDGNTRGYSNTRYVVVG